MIKKLIVSIFVFGFICTNAAAQMNQQIEIFDVVTEKVVKTVPSTPKVRQEAGTILGGITGVVTKINPIPKDGFMIKIPLEPPIKVENQWINELVNEVIVIFPKNENPYIIVFDKNNRAYFLTFEQDTTPLLKLVNFQP